MNLITTPLTDSNKVRTYSLSNATLVILEPFGTKIKYIIPNIQVAKTHKPKINIDDIRKSISK